MELDATYFSLKRQIGAAKLLFHGLDAGETAFYVAEDVAVLLGPRAEPLGESRSASAVQGRLQASFCRRRTGIG
ncbi:MAG TPA: hypothetical protein VF574_12015 [Allosphingosinicella sp.]